MTEAAIYGLRDPREPEIIRYVGQAIDVESRFACHLTESRSSRNPKDLWIKEIRLDKTMPEWVILEEVKVTEEAVLRDAVFAAENKWIAKMVEDGVPIVNATQWKRRMRASGVPRSTIKIYRSLLAKYSPPQSFDEPGGYETAHFLIAIQNDFPQLFFRRHKFLEFYP